MAPLHSYGPGHAQLTFTLRRQHGEDQKDQEQTHPDAEETEGGKDGDKNASHLVGYSDDIPLEVEHLQSGIFKGRQVPKALQDPGRKGHATKLISSVRDQDE